MVKQCWHLWWDFLQRHSLTLPWAPPLRASTSDLFQISVWRSYIMYAIHLCREKGFIHRLAIRKCYIHPTWCSSPFHPMYWDISLHHSKRLIDEFETWWVLGLHVGGATMCQTCEWFIQCASLWNLKHEWWPPCTHADALWRLRKHLQSRASLQTHPAEQRHGTGCHRVTFMEFILCECSYGISPYEEAYK